MGHTMNEMAQAEMANSDDVSLLNILTDVAKSWRLLIFAPLFAGLCALGGSNFISPTYTAVTKFLPPQQQQNAAASMLQNLGALGGFAGAAAGLKNPGDQYVAFLKSRSVQGALIDRFKLQDRYEVELKDDSFAKLNERIRIINGKDGLISVEVDDRDPNFSAQLANAHVEELGKLLSRLAVTEAQQRRQFFEKQLLQTKEKLTKAEQALRATGVNASALKANPTAAVAGVAQLRAHITAQEVKLASMRGYLTESAPALKQALNELNALQAQERKSGDTSALQGNGDRDYIENYREFKYYETLFDMFARQFELAKVDESREGSQIQVLDIAQAPERKSGPKRFLIAAIFSFAVGVLVFGYVFMKVALR
jgi:tyrosine-protein kinase Etk/Wzc